MAPISRVPRPSRRRAERPGAARPTNLPLEDVTGGTAWVAFGYDG